MMPVLRLRGASLVLSLLLLFGFMPLTALQGAAPPFVITNVKIDAYPAVTIMLEHSGLSRAAMEQLVIVENDKERSEKAVVQRSTRLNVAVLFDSYQALPADKFNALADAFDQLDQASWQWQDRQLALFVPQADGKSTETAIGWGPHLWRIITNGILTHYEVRPTASATRLCDLMADSIRQFSKEDYISNHLIVITDGYDKGSVTTPQALQALAQAYNVKIHFVNYDPGVPVGVARLHQLVDWLATDAPVDLSDNQTLLPIWDVIAQSKLKTELGYTVQSKPPFKLALRAKLLDALLESNAHEVRADIPAVNLQIVRPEPGAPIRSSATNVVLHFNWPQPYPTRQISRIQLVLAGGQRPDISNPAISADGYYTVPLDLLPNGMPLLSVTAFESIDGFFTTAQTILNVNAPPIVTPTPKPTLTPKPTPTPTTVFQGRINKVVEVANSLLPESRQLAPPAAANVMGWFAWSSWVLLLCIAMGLVIALRQIWRLWRRVHNLPKPPGAVPGTGSTHEKTTDQWAYSLGEARAELILIQGEGALPGVIAIRNDKTIFGRDFSQVDELLASRYVSQSQFTIWVQNGVFYLTNNTYRNPTYVNDIAAPSSQTAPEQGHRLESGAIIRFGPFKYRFLVNKHADEAANTGTVRATAAPPLSPLTGKRTPTA